MRDGANSLSRAVELLIELFDPDETCRALVLHSHMLHGIGQFDEAASMARRAIAMGAELQDEMVVVAGMTALGNCAIDIGHYREAIDINRKAIAICEERGNVHRAMVCWYNISLCEFENEAWDRSEAALENVFGADRRASRRVIGAAEFNAGVIAESRHDHADANRRYEASLEVRVEHGQDALIIDSLAGLLRIATVDQDRDRMRSLIADIRAHVDDRGFDGVEHYGRLFVALICAFLELGDPERAREYALRGVTFITGRADLLADPGHRTSFLTKVSSHRGLLALAADLGVGPAPNIDSG